MVIVVTVEYQYINVIAQNISYLKCKATILCDLIATAMIALCVMAFIYTRAALIQLEIGLDQASISIDLVFTDGLGWVSVGQDLFVS